MYSCHEKFLPSIFFSFDLCICSQLMLNLLAFRAKMSFTVTLCDPGAEQLHHLVAVSLSRLKWVQLIQRATLYLFINSRALHRNHGGKKKICTHVQIAQHCSYFPVWIIHREEGRAPPLAITWLPSFWTILQSMSTDTHYTQIALKPAASWGKKRFSVPMVQCQQWITIKGLSLFFYQLNTILLWQSLKFKTWTM